MIRLHAILFFIICFSSASAQVKKPDYISSLSKELKRYKVFGDALCADFDSDGDNDCAIILQNKKLKTDVQLYIILFKGDSIKKQNMGALSDTMDLFLGVCDIQNPCFTKLKFQHEGVAVFSNDRSYLFEFDSNSNKFILTAEKHIGP